MNKERKGKKQKTPLKMKLKKFFSNKRYVIILVLIVLILIAGSILAVLLVNRKNNEITGENSSEKQENEERVVKFYDDLTGELVSYSGYQKNLDGSIIEDENGEPAYLSEDQAKAKADSNNLARVNCIQIPNGTDARPQVGLTDAKIVYEAIAEGGITRFAAIFQGTNADVIGPIRSLRMYYLEWDLPYDCTIIHAGGVKAAVQRAESYPHLSESATYMWRDYSGYYAPNNLFTSAKLLNDYNTSKKYNKSQPKVFSRLTPDESDEKLKEIRAAKDDEENESKYTYANSIYIHVTSAANYNVNYKYDSSTNTYLRSYEGNSGKHMSYSCKNTGKSGNKIKPQKDCGSAKQVAPKVVVVIKVPEELNQDNHYREEITTTGSGEAWIFQNGIAIEATWARSSAEAGLELKDKKTGNPIKLTPGQTWITAVAKSYGYVKY
jgi:hypothetical protein